MGPQQRSQGKGHSGHKEGQCWHHFLRAEGLSRASLGSIKLLLEVVSSCFQAKASSYYRHPSGAKGLGLETSEPRIAPEWSAAATWFSLQEGVFKPWIWGGSFAALRPQKASAHYSGLVFPFSLFLITYPSSNPASLPALTGMSASWEKSL